MPVVLSIPERRRDAGKKSRLVVRILSRLVVLSTTTRISMNVANKASSQ